MSTHADGSADVIEVAFLNPTSNTTGQFAGVNLDNLIFETRNETQTLTFTNINAGTNGSFDLNSPLDTRTVNWNPDPKILLNGDGGATTIGIIPALRQLLNPTGGPDNFTVAQVTNTQFTITYQTRCWAARTWNPIPECRSRSPIIW